MCERRNAEFAGWHAEHVQYLVDRCIEGECTCTLAAYYLQDLAPTRALAISSAVCGKEFGSYDVDPCFIEAELLRTGAAGVKDETTAFSLYEKVCARKTNVFEACIQLGEFYRNGTVVPKDEKRARALVLEPHSASYLDRWELLRIEYLALGIGATPDKDAARKEMAVGCAPIVGLKQSDQLIDMCKAINRAIDEGSGFPPGFAMRRAFQ